MILAFELPAERPVEASVFDLAGRRVRALEPGRLFPAGTHRLTWDGRDEAGTPVAPGVYLVRVRAGSDVQVRRAVRLR
jgi:flagellar hook assembly protein FlgD